jgi:hypothetical protein
MVVMEMPGVVKEHTDITVEENVLSVTGRIDFSKFEKLQPVYTEYNIGHFRRSFSLAPSSIDEHKITAEMKDGVLTLTLPKAERIKARKIELQYDHGGPCRRPSHDRRRNRGDRNQMRFELICDEEGWGEQRLDTPLVITVEQNGLVHRLTPYRRL